MKFQTMKNVVKLIVKGIILYTTLFLIGILICGVDNITIEQASIILPASISGVVTIKYFISEEEISTLLGWKLLQKYC